MQRVLWFTLGYLVAALPTLWVVLDAAPAVSPPVVILALVAIVGLCIVPMAAPLAYEQGVRR